MIAVGPFAGDPAAWDRFVDAAPDAVFFQRSGWRRVLAGEFGFAARDLVASRDGDIVGVLPLCEVPLGGGRRCWLSQPFAVEAGVCAADVEAAAALAAAAVDRARAAGVDYVELRDGRSGDGFVAREDRYATFRAALPADEAAHWAALPRKRRRMIRRARERGLEVRTGLADLEAFHDLHARSLRRLGSPVFPLGYFARLVHEFPCETLLLTVCDRGVPVAAALSFVFRGRLLPYYAGSSAAAPALAANDFLYWELMCRGRACGADTFDFGRSRIGSGAWAYKRNWGFTPRPVVYRRRAAAGTLPAERSIDSPALRLLRRGWRHVPLAVTKVLGPPLLRRYGVRFT